MSCIFLLSNQIFFFLTSLPQVSLHSLPSTTQADSACCQGRHCVNLGIGSGHPVSGCSSPHGGESPISLHGAQQRLQSDLAFVHLLRKLCQSTDEEDLYRSSVCPHLPAAPRSHHTDVHQHRSQTLFLRGRKQGAATGQHQETRSANGIAEKDQGGEDAGGGDFAFHGVMAATLDTDDDDRLWRLGQGPTGPPDKLHLSFRTLAGFFQLQREPHCLRLLQQKL